MSWIINGEEMKKRSAFPNKYLKSQQEYFDFVDKYHIFGREANVLKKKINKNIIKS